MGEQRQRAIVLAGDALLAVVGRDQFYHMAQDKPGVLERLSAAFCGFTPKELQSYLDAMRSVRRLIISDPVTFGNAHTRDSRSRSRHMDQYMWLHNYFGYLEAAGFQVERLETRTFVYSWNPRARVVLVEGCRE